MQTCYILPGFCQNHECKKATIVHITIIRRHIRIEDKEVYKKKIK